MCSHWNKLCTFRFCPSLWGPELYCSDPTTSTRMNEAHWTMNPWTSTNHLNASLRFFSSRLQLESFINIKTWNQRGNPAARLRAARIWRLWDDLTKMNLMHIWQMDMQSEHTSVCTSKHLPQRSIFTLNGQISQFDLSERLHLFCSSVCLSVYNVNVSQLWRTESAKINNN